MSDFLSNIWYMGAWAYEVTDVPLSRRLLGSNVMFYRKSDGDVVAMADRCPHRYAPLSRGRIINDQVRCAYHGLMFDGTGQCMSAPLQENPPRVIRAKTFPVVERHGMVWIWPGAPELADAGLIPDFSYLSDPAYKHVFGVTRVEAHYELETDNLMDLSHVEMLHPSFAGVLSPRSEFKAFREGNTVHAHWISTRAPNPAAMEFGPFPTKGAPIDQWLEMRWDPPGAMFLQVASTRSGEERQAGYTMPGVHVVTPETEQATLYFWAGSLGADDPAPMDMFRQSFVQTFEHEDRPMIEAVAAQMAGETDLLAMKPPLLKGDAGGVMARRVMKELIASERGLSVASAA